MTTMELVRLALDNANTRVQELEVENRKLRAQDPQKASEVDKDREMEQLKELYEQALRDLQDKQKEVEEVNQQLGGLQDQSTRLHKLEVETQKARETIVEQKKRQEELQESWDRQRDKLELEKHRALEQERQKWEQREARLVRELDGLQNLRWRKEQHEWNFSGRHAGRGSCASI